MEYFLIIILSYLVGTINPAHLITRHKKKIDIRDVNSKNAGTSNVVMTLGLKWGIVVGILDLFKGFLPVLIVRLLFPGNDILWVISGLSAIIGHIYPFHMKFKGGKGTATFGGVCFAILPLISVGLFVAFFIVLIISDYIVVPTLLSVVAIPVIMYFNNFSYISVGLIVLFTILSLYKHSPNILRILRQEEVGLKEGLKKE